MAAQAYERLCIYVRLGRLYVRQGTLLQAIPLQAHCHLGLGTLYATTGQREQVRTALATAIDLYRAIDDLLATPGRSRTGADGWSV